MLDDYARVRFRWAEQSRQGRELVVTEVSSDGGHTWAPLADSGTRVVQEPQDLPRFEITLIEIPGHHDVAR